MVRRLKTPTRAVFEVQTRRILSPAAHRRVLQKRFMQ